MSVLCTNEVSMDVQNINYREIASILLQKIPDTHVPTIGIICGSGLSGLSATMTDTISFDYSRFA